MNGPDEEVKPSSQPRQIIRPTKELTVNIHGEVYDVMLIPRIPLVEVDYTQCPEDDPLRRENNIEKMIEVVLVSDVDLRGGRRLTEAGARKLLESL